LLGTSHGMDHKQWPAQSRPGVLKRGWLSKEGAHTLSRAFPSRRFCIVVDGRLEYYEERQVQLKLLQDGTTGISLNNWNLVLHEQQDGLGVLVGDIVTKLDGSDLGLQTLNDVIVGLQGGVRRSSPYKLTVLRPKGEVPLVGAQMVKIGRDRLQVTPSPCDLVDARPPYVFIAETDGDRDAWHAAIELSAQQAEQLFHHHHHQQQQQEQQQQYDDLTSTSGTQAQ